MNAKISAGLSRVADATEMRRLQDEAAMMVAMKRVGPGR